MYTLYCLTFPNNKKYIGITLKFNRRMSQHKYVADKGKKFKLHNAIKKYGWENVKKEIIIFNLSKIDSMTLEKQLIADMNLIKNGYNTTPGGEIISENNRLRMIERMSNIEYRKKCVNSLKSNEIKRIEKLRSYEIRTLNSNSQKQRYLAGKCSLPDNSKPILCIENNKIYKSSADAAKDMKLNARNIRRVANGERAHHKGYTFKFINEVTNVLRFN